MSDLQHLISSIERIDSRLHETTLRLEEKLESTNQVLLRNTITLEDHVRRTNLLEGRVDHIQKDVDGLSLHIHRDEWLRSTAFRVGAFTAAAITFFSTVLTAWLALKK